MSFERRMPVGAEVQSGGGVHFRVWASRRKRAFVVIEAGPGMTGGAPVAIELQPEEGGYFSGHVAQAAAGTRYRYRLDDEEHLFPDPVSRYQPDGAHSPSEVIDPNTYQWQDKDWPGVQLKGQVAYEMHIGTFTKEGNYAAAIEQFQELADLGITLLEVMPVNEFPGRFGWGYDGVDLFAPTRLYGAPDDLRRFVDAAHAVGLGVILDVVYNHFGPSGNYLRAFTEHYMTDRHANEWGEAINFDDPYSGPVREFFISNAGYWIDEFHFDGLRLDATQAIIDDSPEHILACISRRVRDAARGRGTVLISENERQEAHQVESVESGGHGLDAVWNDDFHHSAIVAMTGRNEFYYSDYLGTPQELLSAIKWGYLYQGQWASNQKKRRGTPCLTLAAEKFVTFIQNHDQVANSARGLRVHYLTSPGRYRAITALMLLSPGTPMFFQGQEFAASAPFYYFADHEWDLAQLVNSGRASFLKQFRSIACSESTEHFIDPSSLEAFERCKLDFTERERHSDIYTMHRDLLKLRREDAVFSSQRADRIHGAVLAQEAFVLRYLGENGDDRLLLVNLGRDHYSDPSPEPLLAPPRGKHWEKLWSTEHPKYGGSGTPALDTAENWRIPGHTAVVLYASEENIPEPVAHGDQSNVRSESSKSDSSPLGG